MTTLDPCYHVTEFRCGCGQELDGTKFVSMRLEVEGLDKSVVLLMAKDELSDLMARLRKWEDKAFGPGDEN